MRKAIVYSLPGAVLLIFSIVLSAETVAAQESATAEVSPATPTPRKAPTLDELAAALVAVQLENSQLKSQVQTLQDRVMKLERLPSVSDHERRIQALEEAAVTDVYRELGIRRDQPLESWHREIHKRDRTLRGWTEQELEVWHKRDHERRRSLLQSF